MRFGLCPTSNIPLPFQISNTLSWLANLEGTGCRLRPVLDPCPCPAPLRFVSGRRSMPGRTDGALGTGPPQVRGGASAWPQSRGPPSPSRPCPRAAAPRSGTPPHPFPVVFRPERTHPKHHQRIATALRLRVCRGPAVPSRFLRIQARQAQKTRAMCRIGGQPGAETARRSRPARPRRPLGARAGTRPRRTEQSIIIAKIVL